MKIMMMKIEDDDIESMDEEEESREIDDGDCVTNYIYEGNEVLVLLSIKWQVRVFDMGGSLRIFNAILPWWTTKKKTIKKEFKLNSHLRSFVLTKVFFIEKSYFLYNIYTNKIFYVTFITYDKKKNS